MTDRKAQKRRLERAGFVYREGGWLPENNPSWQAFRAQVVMYDEDVARIVAEPPMPRGRPRKAQS
jgi:hypothetical protein